MGTISNTAAPASSVKTTDTKTTSPNTQSNNNVKNTVKTDDKGGKHDSLDYTFTLDKDVVGEWEQINFVDTI